MTSAWQCLVCLLCSVAVHIPGVSTIILCRLTTEDKKAKQNHSTLPRRSTTSIPSLTALLVHYRELRESRDNLVLDIERQMTALSSAMEQRALQEHQVLLQKTNFAATQDKRTDKKRGKRARLTNPPERDHPRGDDTVDQYFYILCYDKATHRSDCFCEVFKPASFLCISWIKKYHKALMNEMRSVSQWDYAPRRLCYCISWYSTTLQAIEQGWIWVASLALQVALCHNVICLEYTLAAYVQRGCRQEGRSATPMINRKRPGLNGKGSYVDHLFVEQCALFLNRAIDTITGATYLT